ncbi:putative bifunctional diguanylate cyclase/phosphodiesterase [uncultured Sphingomonas sp.]|uniref:putative bifunctional diguanylate cyclase/phosphodiesterase n=1 Tax=uncultured Sphingomonas sp. TaxID=158754 RepID=UPI0035C9DD23
MFIDNPADWMASGFASPGEAASLHREIDDRLDGIATAVAHATGCDKATIYRHHDGVLRLVAGSGPATLQSGAVLAGFADAGASDCSGAIRYCGELIDGERWADCPLPRGGFVAAARIVSGDSIDGIVAVAGDSRHDPLSAAQAYVLQAYAELAGTVLELHALRQRALATGTDNSAAIARLRLLESVAVHANDSILITEAEPLDLPGPRILYCNEAFTRTTGYSLEEVLGKTPRILQGPKTDAVARAKLRAAFARWQPVTVELTNYRKDGSEFWVELSIAPVANDDGWFTHWISVQRDITERKHKAELSTRVRIAEVENQALANEIRDRKRIEEQLLYTAFHDSLTRLRNRAFFMDRLKNVLDVNRRDPSLACAILFLDLDRFKVVNDSLGHLAGEVLLKEIARRLKTCVRPQDTLARIGGDEFALLVEEAADLGVPIALAERILEALRPPVRVGRQDVFPSTSIGIVRSSSRDTQPEALIRDADIAMYAAKRSGFGQYAIFSESMHAEATAMLTLQSDLKLAIERQEFEVAYQPIVDPQRGLIKGFEALLRWQHPTRGTVSPAEFVPIAEEIGVIRQIDRWVMNEACAQLAKWRALFPDADLGVSINTSATEFNDPRFLSELKDTIARFSLPPRALELEITESIFLHPDPRIESILTDIRAHGVRIGLDDFGTGYSSLSYLNRYPTDTIKIDQSFIRSLCSDDRTLAIVVLIIQLARTLNVEVVAEGVETEEQAELLASMSCSLAQGYFFSRPITAVAATSLMSHSMTLTGTRQDQPS